MTRTDLDDRDRAILSHRAGLYWASRTDIATMPRVGDFIDFACGATRRVSHVWDWGTPSVQTSRGGSFYLGEGVCSFSGGLAPIIDPATLTLTGETRDGHVWFFHHDHWTGGNGVETTMPFPVYRCSLAAPSM